MLVCQARRDPASWSAIKEADLDQEGLVDLFERVLLLGQRRRKRVQTDRAAISAAPSRSMGTPSTSAERSTT